MSNRITEQPFCQTRVSSWRDFQHEIKFENKMNKYGKNTGYFWWKQRHKIAILKWILIISVIAGMFWIARKQILGRAMFYEDYYNNKVQSEQSR